MAVSVNNVVMPIPIRPEKYFSIDIISWMSEYYVFMDGFCICITYVLPGMDSGDTNNASQDKDTNIILGMYV